MSDLYGDIMEKSKYLEIGQIVNTHGIKGEVRVKPWCDAPSDLTGLEAVYSDGGNTEYAVTSARVHKNVVVMKLVGIDTVEQAQKLRNKVLLARREDFSLPEGRYFVADLLGMEVVDDASGVSYGRLTDVLQYGAADVYEVTGEASVKILIPATDDTVISRDFESGEISVRLPDGLLDSQQGGKAE